MDVRSYGLAAGALSSLFFLTARFFLIFRFDGPRSQDSLPPAGAAGRQHGRLEGSSVGSTCACMWPLTFRCERGACLFSLRGCQP